MDREAPNTGKGELEQIVRLALAEDLGEKGDITSRAIFDEDDRGAASIIAREACVLSGLDAGREICRQADPALIWLPLAEDGQSVPAGAEVVRLEGKMVSILAAERTIINFISHLSGIASYTHRFVRALDGLATRVAATRKTLPGMRLLEKQAVVHGGGESHRTGLYDAVLIKDNHIAAAGSLTEAVEAVRGSLGEAVAMEVEADTPGQLEEAIAAGVGRVLLDNMTPEQVRSCARASAGSLTLEASGGINLENVRAYGEAGADVVSIGMLTMSAPAIDFSLEVAS